MSYVYASEDRIERMLAAPDVWVELRSNGQDWRARSKAAPAPPVAIPTSVQEVEAAAPTAEQLEVTASMALEVRMRLSGLLSEDKIVFRLAEAAAERLAVAEAREAPLMEGKGSAKGQALYMLTGGSSVGALLKQARARVAANAGPDDVDRMLCEEPSWSPVLAARAIVEAELAGTTAVLACRDLDRERIATVAGILAGSRLLSLDISSNALGSAGAATVAGVIQSHACLRELNVSSCLIRVAGARALAAAVAAVACPLVSLVLDSNAIGDDGAVAIANALRVTEKGEVASSLHTLRLFNCGLCDRGAAEIVQATLTSGSKLQILDCSSNHITRVGCAAIAAALATPETVLQARSPLNKLSLFGNDFELEDLQPADLAQLRQVDKLLRVVVRRA